tara:strand:- start:565 stop:1329 length:765 start_codon:yes stop_codon:yes gene_type:complete
MIKKIVKDILKFFNYKIISKNEWNKKVENLIVEASDEELKMFEKINEISLTSLPNRWSLYQSLSYIRENNIEGDIVETGVFKGANLVLINDFLNQFNIDKKIYAYDTYEGQPKPSNLDFDYKGNSMIKKFSNSGKKNNNSVYCSLENVKKNLQKYSINNLNKIIFIKGKVEETLNDENNLPSKISLLRLDTDFYDSIKKSLEILYPKLTKGGILIIDDYGHFKGAKIAVDNYFKDKKSIWMHRVDYTCRLMIKP